MSVSHLPGGDALDAMLQKVAGTPGDIDRLATAWQSVSGDIKEFAGALSSAVQNVNEAWRGNSADHFNTYMHKYGAAAESLKTVLSNAASSLKGAATALRESHAEISSICGDLSTNAADYEARYKADNPDATAEDIKPGLTTLVEQAKADAQPWVDSADLAVTKAKNDINRFLGADRGPTFRGIPEVTKQDFIPTPGRTIDWRPDPSYQEQNGTTTQGHQGSPVGGASYGSSGPPPPGGGPAPTGQVKEWIEEAVSILAASGVPVSKMNAEDIWMIIRHESGGNPNAINNWDSNAANGTPSKGLMQTIDPTFNAHALAGHKNIYDPVDNIIAGVRYAISRYGSVSGVPGVVNVKNGLDYVGY